jgi:hypothetical protein
MADDRAVREPRVAMRQISCSTDMIERMMSCGLLVVSFKFVIGMVSIVVAIVPQRREWLYITQEVKLFG